MTAGNRTAMNLATVSTASLLQIVNQFVFFSILAAYYGASADSDALAAAAILPMALAAIVTGSLSYVLIPDLVAKFEDNSNTQPAWQLASFVGLVTLLVSGAISVLLLIGARSVCELLYYDMLPDEIKHTSRMLQILSVQVLTTGLITWAQAVHHSRHSFLVPALGGVLGTGLQIAIAMWIGERDISVIAWAINLGSVVSLLIHLGPLLPSLTWPHVATAHLLRLLTSLWPLLLGAAFIRLDPIVDRVLAAELDAGSVAHIHFAQRIMAALLAIGTSGLAVIAFPQLAQRFANEGASGFAAHFSLALRRLLLMVVPIVIGVSMFAVPIIRDLLERGQFTADDSRTVGYLVVVLMGMFVGASTGELLSRAFYVLGDTKTPTVVGAVSMVAALGVKFALFKVVGIWGIALGVSGYFMLSATTLAVVLKMRTPPHVFSGSGRYLLHAITAALVACACCYVIYATKLGNTWIAGPVGVVVYFLVLVILRNPDSLQFAELAKSRLLRK